MDEQRLPALVRDLYRIVGELEEMFDGRHFTPDGHMVGSLGECLVAHHYGVELYPASRPGHDGHFGGREVQIKATQGDSIGLRSEPQHLICIVLNMEGGFEEVYNGPGRPIWDRVKNKSRPSNGQYQVSVAFLRKLATEVATEDRIPRRTATLALAVPDLTKRGLLSAGFTGFVPVRELQATACAGVADEAGVYAVVRANPEAPRFLSKSTGGHFKGKDPSVPLAALKSKWVEGAQLLYVGMTEGQTLRKRLVQSMKFGMGQPVGHWGGRYLWQLADAAAIEVCWKPVGSGSRATKVAILEAFEHQYGTLPYANLNR